MQYSPNHRNLIDQHEQKLGFPHGDTANMHFKYPKIPNNQNPCPILKKTKTWHHNNPAHVFRHPRGSSSDAIKGQIRATRIKSFYKIRKKFSSFT